MPGQSIDPARRAKPRKVRRALAKQKVGQRKIQVNKLTLRELAGLGCTDKEISTCLGMSLRTFADRKRTDPEFLEAYESGQATGKVSLRLLQKQHSEGEGGPAVNMTIHRSKHLLGEFDKPTDTHQTVDVNIDINSAGERLVAKLDDLRRRLLGSDELPQLEILDTVPECVDRGVVEHDTEGSAGRVQGGPDARGEDSV